MKEFHIKKILYWNNIQNNRNRLYKDMAFKIDSGKKYAATER